MHFLFLKLTASIQTSENMQESHSKVQKINSIVQSANIVKNEMKINPDKSKAVSFTKARVKERTRYYFGEQLIRRQAALNI